MQQIETLGKGVDKFLVLSGILAQIDLCLGVTGIAVILALVQEEVVLLIVVLVEDRHAQFVGKFPASLIVGVILVRTRTSGTNDDNLRMSLCHTLIDIFKALDELWRDLLLVTDTQIRHAS